METAVNEVSTIERNCAGAEDRPILVAGITSLAVGVVVLAGWMLNIDIFNTVVPGWAPMKANAGLGFVLLGTLLLNYRRRTAVRSVVSCLAAAILVALSAATLLEYL